MKHFKSGWQGLIRQKNISAVGEHQLSRFKTHATRHLPWLALFQV
jgi:hypothetical protein